MKYQEWITRAINLQNTLAIKHYSRRIINIRYSNKQILNYTKYNRQKPEPKTCIAT